MLLLNQPHLETLVDRVVRQIQVILVLRLIQEALQPQIHQQIPWVQAGLVVLENQYPQGFLLVQGTQHRLVGQSVPQVLGDRVVRLVH